jgi:hypothetical protein
LAGLYVAKFVIMNSRGHGALFCPISGVARRSQLGHDVRGDPARGPIGWP